MTSDNGRSSCSFCGKGQHEVKKLIAGPSVYACSECILLMMDILGEEARRGSPPIQGHAPDELRKYLSSDVLGQAPAVEALVATLLHHRMRARTQNLSLRAPNVLLVGERGTGKSTLGNGACRASGLRSHATHIESLLRYPPNDIECMLGELAEESYRTNAGVIFLDGLEQLTRDTATNVSLLALQRMVIRLLDGHALLMAKSVPKGSRYIETEGLLIVAAVTVQGALPSRPDSRTVRSALTELGLLPELVARFPTIAVLDRLDASALDAVLDRELAKANEVLSRFGSTLYLDEDAKAVVIEHLVGDPDGAWAVGRVIAGIMAPLFAHPAHRSYGADDIRAFV